MRNSFFDKTSDQRSDTPQGYGFLNQRMQTCNKNQSQRQKRKQKQKERQLQKENQNKRQRDFEIQSPDLVMTLEQQEILPIENESREFGVVPLSVYTGISQLQQATFFGAPMKTLKQQQMIKHQLEKQEYTTDLHHKQKKANFVRAKQKHLAIDNIQKPWVDSTGYDVYSYLRDEQYARSTLEQYLGFNKWTKIVLIQRMLQMIRQHRFTVAERKWISNVSGSDKILSQSTCARLLNDLSLKLVQKMNNFPIQDKQMQVNIIRMVNGILLHHDVELVRQQILSYAKACRSIRPSIGAMYLDQM